MEIRRSNQACRSYQLLASGSSVSLSLILTNLTNLVYTERMVANVLSPEELVTEAKKEVGEDETRLQVILLLLGYC